MLYEPGLRQSTSKLTRGLAWTGPYRIKALLPHNNVQLTDLRDNRLHDVVNLDRLRRYQGARAWGDDMFVLDELLDVRKVPKRQARGPSQVEFLVKWRQYRRQDSTWEPLEELKRTCPEEV